MSENQNSTQVTETIEALQQSYNNIKIFTAVPMGVILLLYFFTFAMLVDKGMHGALMFQIITAVLFVFYFIFINQAAFVILKLLKKNKTQYREILPLMQAPDLSMEPEALTAKIESRH